MKSREYQEAWNDGGKVDRFEWFNVIGSHIEKDQTVKQTYIHLWAILIISSPKKFKKKKAGIYSVCRIRLPIYLYPIKT